MHTAGIEFQCLAVQGKKPTVDIEILITTRKGGIKIMQPIRITSGTVKKNEEVEPVHPV